MIRNWVGPGGERLLIWLLVAAVVAVVALVAGVPSPVDLGAFDPVGAWG